MTNHAFKGLSLPQYVLIILALCLMTLGIAPSVDADSILIPAPDRADVVHDAQRNILYITSGGQVLRYSLVTQQFLAPFQLGGKLEGIDLSPDGNTLAIADGTYSTTQVWIYLVDLRTGASQKVTFPFTSVEGESWGTWSVAFGNDGNILITESNQLSPLRKFNPTAGTTTILLNVVTGGTALNSSADGNVIGFAQGDTTSGSWGLYRVSDGFLAQRWDGTYNLNYEIATNRTGSQFAIPTFTGTYIYNSSLSYLTLLWQPPAGSLEPQGAVYDPIKDVLYLSWGGTQEVRAFETNNFTQVATFNFGSTFQHEGMSQTYQTGRLKISRDGSLLFAIVDGGVRYVRLSGSDINALIAEKERVCALGWISSSGTCKSLDDKLDSAKAALERNKLTNAKQILNDFINELDAQKGKTVNQQAYDLLKADALYVINMLP